MVLEFAGRTERYLQEARQVGVASPAAALGDVGRDRGAGTSHLTRKPVHLFPGKTAGDLVDTQCQPVPPLPNLEPPEFAHARPPVPSNRRRKPSPVARNLMPDACPSLLLLLGVLRARLLDGVAAELAAERREDLHGEGVVLARGEAGEEGACDGVGRDALVYGLHHRPAALARVLDVAPDAVEVRVLLEGVLGKLEEPAPDDAPLVPEARKSSQVVVVAGPLEDLEPFGVGLHHPV